MSNASSSANTNNSYSIDENKNLIYGGGFGGFSTKSGAFGGGGGGFVYVNDFFAAYGRICGWWRLY